MIVAARWELLAPQYECTDAICFQKLVSDARPNSLPFYSKASDLVRGPMNARRRDRRNAHPASFPPIFVVRLGLSWAFALHSSPPKYCLSSGLNFATANRRPHPANLSVLIQRDVDTILYLV